MENEQEGIDIETLDPENQGKLLPSEESEIEIIDDSDDTVDGVDEPEDNSGNDTEPTIDEEKELLKKGVNAERSKRKAAEKKNRELEARIKALEEANKTPTKTTAEELIENGVDESIAKSIAKAIDSKQDGSKEELAELKFKLAISEAEKNPDFKDIADYADEIRTLVDKGLTVEQSYYALTGNKKTSKSEIERKLEVKLENKQARKEILGSANNNAGTSVNSNSKKVKATSLEIAVARAAGMSIEEYLATKEIDNVKDYNKYKESKGKK